MSQKSLTPVETIKCEKCGNEFGCGIEAGGSTCWCFQYDTLKKADLSKSCLCPKCLEEDIEEPLGGPVLG